MPAPRIGVFSCYGHAWRQFWKHFLHLFLVGLIAFVASIPLSFGNGGDETNVTVFAVFSTILVAAYYFLIYPVVEFGAAVVNLRFMRDEQADVRGVFEGFQTNYLNIILANLLTFAIIGIGLLLLIVPGIIFLCRLVFVPYLVMDKGLDPVAAVEKSWSMTRGSVGWRVFGMFLLSVPIMMLGVLILVIGAFFTAIWIYCAFASMYYAVDSDEQQRLDRNGGGDAATESQVEPSA